MIVSPHLLLAVRQGARTGTRLPAACAALGLLCALALTSPAAALQQRLTTTGSAIGYAVAVDGDTLVLGDPLNDGGVGAVYVFQRSGDVWTNTATLTASDASADDNLGVSVAIDGDTIVAGANGDGIDQDATSQGSVYTFARSGAPSRTQTAKLTDAEGALGDQLGYSVAIAGDTIVAGAPGKPVGTHAQQGVVDTFARTGADRTQTARLIVPDGAANDRLGVSAAIDGDAIVAGAPNVAVGANAQQGSLYKFSRAGAAQRTPTAKLTATPGAAFEHLGSAVDMDGDTVVGGAPGDASGDSTGAAYTFARTGAAARTQTATLTAADGAGGDALGYSVAIDGATIVVGGPTARVGDNAAQGAAYTFARAGAPGRRETAKLTDADGSLGQFFAFAVAIDGDTILAGSPVTDSASVFFSPAPVPPAPAPAVSPSLSVPSLTARTDRPVLSRLAVSPGTIHRVQARSAKASRPARITFSLSVAASVELRFERARPGRAVGSRCAKPSRSNGGKPRCTRYVAAGRLTVHGKRGANAVRFTGRLPGHGPLPAGRYRLTGTPADGSGNRGAARSTTLTIANR